QGVGRAKLWRAVVKLIDFQLSRGYRVLRETTSPLQNNLPPLAITVFNAVDATAHVGAGIDPEFCHLPDTVHPAGCGFFPECCWPSPNGARPRTWPRLCGTASGGGRALFPHRLPMPRSKLRSPGTGMWFGRIVMGLLMCGSRANWRPAGPR